MKYEKTTPCGLCPFRNDSGRLRVSAERLAGMASGEFACHKTCELDDETGDYKPTKESQHCAGALIFLEKQNAPHQMMRISERLGFYDRSGLNMDAPVFGSLSEVTEADGEGDE
jgi:hypothetical protein